MTYYYWVASKRYLVSIESVSARYYFFRSLHELYDNCVCYEDGCCCGKGFFNYCWWECLQSLKTFFPQCVVYVHSREYVNGWRKGCSCAHAGICLWMKMKMFCCSLNGLSYSYFDLPRWNNLPSHMRLLTQMVWLGIFSS